MKTNYYICSDLHGQYNLWKQIQEYLKENDVLIFLGDAIDRGSDGIKIMKEMFADKRVIYLLGNHEDMMLDWWLSRGETREESEFLKHWLENGGRPTYETFLSLTYEEKIEIIEKIKKLDYEMKISYQCEDGGFEVYLNHAGSNPHRARHDRFTCIWDRSHFNHRWPKGNNNMIIHGHTPRQILERSYCVQFEKDMVTYCDGHKVCLDWGCFATGVIPLYNLNELKLEKIFYKPEEDTV